MGQKLTINIVVPETVVTEVAQKLQECRTALAPYLVALTNEQKASLFKMGDKSVATVQKVRDYLETNPEFKPSYMDQELFNNDVAAVMALNPLQKAAAQITSDLRDTVMLAGSEAMTSGMQYYGAVKEAARQGVQSAQVVYDDLSKRFTRRGFVFEDKSE